MFYKILSKIRLRYDIMKLLLFKEVYMATKKPKTAAKKPAAKPKTTAAKKTTTKVVTKPVATPEKTTKTVEEKKMLIKINMFMIR